MTFTGDLVTLAASASSVGVDTPVILNWSSPPGTTSCTATGGSGSDGWAGSLSASGTKDVTETTTSTVTYSIDCYVGGSSVQAQAEVTYTPPTATDPTTPTPEVTLATSAASQVVGSPVTISWSSQDASACTASGGASDDGWSGSLPLSGNMWLRNPLQAPFIRYHLHGAPPAASASAEVSFSSVTVTASSGKSGGGGALDRLSLALLGLLVCQRMRRRLSCAE